MDREALVYADLDGQTHLVGRLWARTSKNRQSATFEYDVGWLGHLTAWIVGCPLSVAPQNRQHVFLTMHRDHASVLAFPDAGFLRCTRIAENIVGLIPLCPTAVCSRHLLSRRKYSHRMLLLVHKATRLQLFMDL